MANRCPTGARSIQARMRQLQGLRNVGHKIFLDKKYKEQLLDDGMDFVSKRTKRAAVVQMNEYNRQIKKHLVDNKFPDVEGLRQWTDSQEGLEDSSRVIQQENFRHPPVESKQVRYESKKSPVNTKKYVTSNFHVSGGVNLGPPRANWLPATPKTYY